MAGITEQEDITPCNSKMPANKQSVLVDIGSVQSRNLKLVSFNPIGELIPLEENLALRYQISKSFHPKSGDWIGLFQVSHNSADKYLYIGFHWAQKHPYDKKKPLERLVHFRINEFNMPVNCGKDTYYQFLYMTHSEKLVGCSNIFGIRICLPLVRKLNATSGTTSAVRHAPRILASIAGQQQRAIVPYEFFHQQYAQLQMDNVVIHLCYEDLAARCCVIDPIKHPVIDRIKYPVSHRFAGSQGLKDWSSRLSHNALSSYSPPNGCTRCQQSRDIIRSLQKRIILLRRPAKQCEMNNCICSNNEIESKNEIESLKTELKQLKQKVLLLEEALSEECSAKADLIRINHHIEQEMMRKLKGMTTWLMERRTFMGQNQHPCSLAPADQHRKDQVHINQPCKPRFNTASPHDNLNNTGTSKPPEVTQNEHANSQNLGLQSTLKKKKKKVSPLNHNTYSGSRIGLRYLFKENSNRDTKKEQPSVDDTYSGSNLSLRFLFDELIPDKARREQHSGNIQGYSGSNHLLGRRFYERTAKDQASSSNTYSGSNLALSYLFSEENEEETTSFKASSENGSCVKCFCQCKAQIVKETNDKALHDVSGYKIDTESMKLKKDNVDEGLKRKTEKSVQINSKKLIVYFQNDKDQQEELQLNDAMTAESDPGASSDYLVEIKDKLVKVTGQSHGPNVSQETKSAPDTTETAAGVEVIKAPIAITSYSIARPKPEPRKKSKRSPGINNSTQCTKQATEYKKDAVIQVDGLLYSGGVYWVSSELPGLAKPAPATLSMSYQETSEVIPPTKSLTMSAVAATDGKQDVSKDSATLTTQADISRDAKSAYSLGKTGINSHGNETSIGSNPTITSTNCRPAANKNVVAGSGAQGTTNVPTMVGTIQSIDMTDIASMSQLTVIKDLSIISIPTSTDAAANQALHTLEKVNPDSTMTPPVTSNPEENKKRKRYSATGSSALSKSKNADGGPPLATPTKSNKIQKNACLASGGSEFCNFIYTVKQRLPKSPTMPLVPDDLARSNTLIQPVTTSHCPTGTSGTIQSTKSESKTLPLMSVHSTGAGPRTSTQLNKVLPPPSCPLLPPTQAILQPAFQPDTDDEYPPLPSARPNIVGMKPGAGQDDTSYASVTRRDKKPVSRPGVAMCSLHSLAKLAKDIILKYYKSDEEMKASYAKTAIPKDISPLGQNQHDSQKKMLEKICQDNDQESAQVVENASLGSAQKNTEDVSAPEQDSSKTIERSTVIKEPLMEENENASTTKNSLAINKTPANADPNNNNLISTVQQDKDSRETSLTVAAQESVRTNVMPTKRKGSIKTEDAQTNRQDVNKIVTMKTGQKDSAQKSQAPNRKQHSKKADLNLTARQLNANTGPTAHESIKTTQAQSILQHETSQEESVKTDLNIATTIDSPTIDQVHTTAQTPPLTDPTPDCQDTPKTDQSSPTAQNVKKPNQTPSKRQDTNQESPTKTNLNTITQSDPQDTRGRPSAHSANLLQEDKSGHT